MVERNVIAAMGRSLHLAFRAASSPRVVTAGGHGGGNVPLDVKYLYLNVITIFGNPIDTPDNFELALQVAAEGKLKVLIDKVLPLQEARRAHEIVEERSGIGEVVLTP
jgi:NADPH:quinone reductase-like Zn-dependent oxidoreductase